MRVARSIAPPDRGSRNLVNWHDSFNAPYLDALWPPAGSIQIGRAAHQNRRPLDRALLSAQCFPTPAPEPPDQGLGSRSQYSVNCSVSAALSTAAFDSSGDFLASSGQRHLSEPSYCGILQR